MMEEKKYGIWAKRKYTSVLGPAEAWCKNDGRIMLFDTYEEACTYAARLNRGKGIAQVEYFPKEVRM